MMKLTDWVLGRLTQSLRETYAKVAAGSTRVVLSGSSEVIAARIASEVLGATRELMRPYPGMWSGYRGAGNIYDLPFYDAGTLLAEILE